MQKKSNVLAGCDMPEFHPAHCKCFPVACVFCEIIRTEVAEGFIAHGSTVVSFTPLKPRVPGHRLFVPTRHASDFSKDPGHGAAAFYWAGRWAAAHDSDYNLITSGGEAATQSILHTHIHYVPRRQGDGLLLPWSNQEKPVDDGLCHAYNMYPGMDCLQPKGHEGNHGDV